MSRMSIYRITRTLADGSRYILGFAVKNEQGWWFNPNNASHKPSRKAHPTMKACLPRWVRNYYDSEEVK